MAQQSFYRPAYLINEEGIEQSSFNSARFLIIRLNNLWLRYQNNRFKEDLAECMLTLGAAWGEFYADATKKQRAKVAKIDKAINILAGKIVVLEALNKTTRAITNDSKRVKANRTLVVKLLKKKLMRIVEYKYHYLRELEKDQGLGKAYKDGMSGDLF